MLPRRMDYLMGYTGLMNTKIIIAILTVVAIGGGYYYYTTKQAPAEVAQQPSGKIVPKWTFENVGTDSASGADRTKVTLTLGDKSYDAGTYNGSCAEIGASGGIDGKGLVEGEVSGVQCWFAGGGDEIGLFEVNGQLSLKHGELEEPQGDGSEGVRGGFKTIVTL